MGLSFIYFGYERFKNNLTKNSDWKELEDRFDKNGGFLWSQEVYGI
jgi:hypothetical protein